MKVATINYQGKDYATVPARLKEFRESNPKASIETEPTYHEDGSVTFKAKIIQDRSDEYSATATGNARYTEAELKRPKAFEKLETISVGRALANLGYLNDGQIATTEEMEEFTAYKEDKVDVAIEALSSAETMEQLRDTFLKLGTLVSNPKVIKAKDKRKFELTK